MSKHESLRVLRRPLITEKANDMKESLGQFSFEVAIDANKILIRKAVEDAFKVKVSSVRTTVVRGDKKRVGKFAGWRPNWKRAVVTLAPGHSIDYFEEV